MVRSKINIMHEQDMVSLYRANAPPNGLLPRRNFIHAIKGYLDCTDPTANKLLRKFNNIFIVEDRMVRLREDLIIIEEAKDNEELFENSHDYLDRLCVFLSSKEDVSDFLIKISSVRDEIIDGVFSGLVELLIQLELRFGTEVQELIEEGKKISGTDFVIGRHIGDSVEVTSFEEVDYEDFLEGETEEEIEPDTDQMVEAL